MIFISNKNNVINSAKLVRDFFGAVLLLTFLFSFVPVALANNIVVLTSKNATPYNNFIKAFKKILPDSNIKVLNMNGDIEKGHALIEKAIKTDIDLIVALGSRAAWTVKNRTTPPVLFSMISNPKKYDLIERPGISSVFSFRQQLKIFKKIMPNVKKIGLLHNKKNRKKIDNLEKIAKEMGIDILKKEVNDVRKVASVVDALLMQVDALWLRKNRMITNNTRLVKQVILLPALRKRIPIIGESKWVVQNGALFCLFTSYQSIGAQAGEMVKGVISKEVTGFQPPSIVNVFLNPHVAERLMPGVDIVVPKNAFFVK